MKYYAMPHIPKADHITALVDWPAIGKYSCLADVTSEANRSKRGEILISYFYSMSL